MRRERRGARASGSVASHHILRRTFPPLLPYPPYISCLYGPYFVSVPSDMHAFRMFSDVANAMTTAMAAVLQTLGATVLKTYQWRASTNYCELKASTACNLLGICVVRSSLTCPTALIVGAIRFSTLALSHKHLPR